MINYGKLVRGRAVDKPEYKKSGFEVVVHKAYKDKLPYTIADLNPLPILFRKDYISHLFLYYGYKAYEIYSEEHYKLLDEINIEVQTFLETPIMTTIPEQLSEEVYQEVLGTIQDKDLLDIGKLISKQSLNFMAKNKRLLEGDDETKGKSEEYLISQINILKEQLSKNKI
jgi:hypothetical protein